MRVVEFYSGIGGMHQSLSLSGAEATVVAAFEINPNANTLYEHNFSLKPLQQSIDCLSASQLDSYSADVWLLSPPCQPYTRQKGGL